MALRQFLRRGFASRWRSRWEALQHSVKAGALLWERPLRPVSASRSYIPSPSNHSESEFVTEPIEQPSESKDQVFPAPSSDQVWEESPVWFHQTRLLLRVSQEQTLLEAGLDAGVDLMFACQVGGCAACKIKVLMGEIVMEEDHCLTEDEVADGYCLACVSRAKGPVVLDG